MAQARIENVPLGNIFTHDGQRRYVPHARPYRKGCVFARLVHPVSGRSAASAPTIWKAIPRGTIVEFRPGERVERKWRRPSVHS
jgi:hypothetical protein